MQLNEVQVLQYKDSLFIKKKEHADWFASCKLIGFESSGV